MSKRNRICILISIIFLIMDVNAQYATIENIDLDISSNKVKLNYDFHTSDTIKYSRIVSRINLLELTNPHEIISDGEHLIISDGVEGTNILIYDMENYYLATKFGGSGSEPGKFKVSDGHEVGMDIRNDTLLISSQWKVSFLTKNGKLIKEKPIKQDTYQYKFFGDLFIAIDDTIENDTMFYTFNIYNNDLKFEREITRVAGSNQGANGLQVLVRDYQGLTYMNKYYFKGKSNDFEIEIFDKNGTSCSKITQEYMRVPLEEEHKNSVIAMYKEHPLFSQFINYIIDKLVFPQYLPAIYNINISEDFIYALTYETNNGNSVIYKINIEGELIDQQSVPLKWRNSTETFPFTISGDKLYQLEQSESGVWHLNVIAI